MFLDLFKKERYPIRLETVRAAKSLLYKTISYDIELLNDYYGIFPEGFAAGLLHDLRELLGNEIAGELRLAFYDPVDPEKVYLERSYRLINGRKGAAGFPHIKKYPLPKPYEFDIFVYFSDGFLALSKGEQERLLNGFNFKWFNFSGGVNGESTGVDAFLPSPDSKRGGRAAFRGGFDDRPLDEFEEEALPDNNYAAADARDVPGTDDTGDTSDVDLPSSPVVARDRETALRPSGDPLASAEDAALLKQFVSDNSLFIAAYTDSRKLIERFTRICAYLGLAPLQWTFSEGFKEIGDKYAGKYSISDNYLLHAKLSPLETLGVIRNECQSHTLYLLEDFHYYLKRENLSGQEFVELISIMKSMPEMLKRQDSFVVILAPTLDLPPEVAPIFGFIRDR